jgi:hypothetical protein
MTTVDRGKHGSMYRSTSFDLHTGHPNGNGEAAGLSSAVLGPRRDLSTLRLVCPGLSMAAQNTKFCQEMFSIPLGTLKLLQQKH